MKNFETAVLAARSRAADQNERTAIAFVPPRWCIQNGNVPGKFVLYAANQVLPWGTTYQGSVSIDGVYSS